MSRALPHGVFASQGCRLVGGLPWHFLNVLQSVNLAMFYLQDQDTFGHDNSTALAQNVNKSIAFMKTPITLILPSIPSQTSILPGCSLPFRSSSSSHTRPIINVSAREMCTAHIGMVHRQAVRELRPLSSWPGRRPSDSNNARRTLRELRATIEDRAAQ